MSQDVLPIRRNYNQWVVNQTLEDFALRFTAKSARKWSLPRVALTALGTTAFLALEAIGGTITLQYGFLNSAVAMVVVCLVIFLIGLPICFNAARAGVDIDLLTRGAGFGYLGSTITSLVYASFTFIFFAIEAAIMAVALQLVLGIPVSLSYAVSALLVIPIVTHGFTFISRFQIGTQYLWLSLQALAIVLVAVHDYDKLPDWVAYTGAEGAAQFDVLVFGAATAVLIALIAQLGEQVDYLRFLPARTAVNARKWDAAVILAGPGWVFVGLVKLLLGGFIAYLLFAQGGSAQDAADPTRMYSQVFAYFHEAPQAALVLAGIMVVLCQMKINVTNAYAGSIAWSNFFSRLTHSHPGRVVWLVFNVLIALLLMVLGIYQVLESVLSVFAILAVSWLTILATDLTLNRCLGLAPKTIEFKRAHLYDINPVGVGAMAISTAVGITAYLGVFGDYAHALSHFLTVAVAALSAVSIAALTRGRFYIARQPAAQSSATVRCMVCSHDYEEEDVAFCPVYGGAICSLCCSLDANCMDQCKPAARFTEQCQAVLGRLLPGRVVQALFSRVGRFCLTFSLSALGMGGLFALMYFVLGERGVPLAGVETALWTLYFLLCIVLGVVTWFFLLASESRSVAHQESLRQTQLLMAEIQAHEETDRELQAAKEAAEAASYAKTRYLSGISHEFRTPLQSILGYAQVLKRDETDGSRLRGAQIIHRSAEHLADLIEGLLDVSRIEAGRIDLRSETVCLPEILNQLAAIFRPLAEQKAVQFHMQVPEHLPSYVRSDPQRLRQILTNVLSNAVKFTSQGRVDFKVRYGSEVAEFEIRDTGPGIEQRDVDSIFRPFERGQASNHTGSVGTGLGLTIVGLLCDVMGGDVTVQSEPGRGSVFTVSLYLPAIKAPLAEDEAFRMPTGYRGTEQTIMVVDDDPIQRMLILDMLVPLGFQMREARDGEDCLRQLAGLEVPPQLLILDVSMPGMSGFTLARAVADEYPQIVVLMMSANAEEPLPGADQVYAHYLVKPIRLDALLDQLLEHLHIEWRYDETTAHFALDRTLAGTLIHHAEIGHASGLRKVLETAGDCGQLSAEQASQLSALVDQMNFAQVIQLAKGASS